MNTDKQYRLLKDIPDAGAGAIFNFSFSSNWCHYVTTGKSGKDVEYDQSFVESQPNEWFEEVKQPPIKEERIEVNELRCYGFNGQETVYQFSIIGDGKHSPLPLNVVKDAVEKFLNDTPNDTVEDKEPIALSNDETTAYFDKAKEYLNKINCTYATTNEQRLRIIQSARFIDIRVRADGREYFFEGEFIKSLTNKKYTQSEVDTIREERFYEGYMACAKYALEHGTEHLKHLCKLNSLPKEQEYKLDNGMGTGTTFATKEQSDNSTGKDDGKEYIEIRYNKFSDGKITPENQFMFIPIEIFEETKQAIQSVFDKHYPQPPTPSNDIQHKNAMRERGNDIQEGKDWEIESYACDGNGTIKSVRRLSDGAVASVGSQHYMNGYISAISKFEINNDKMMVWFIGLNIPYELSELPPPNKEKDTKVLFTTEDGVGITDRGHKISAIKKGAFDIIEQHSGETLGVWLNGWYTTEWLRNPTENDFNVVKLINEHYLLFSTKEAAEQYILENKPCLSLNDLLEVWDKDLPFHYDKEYYKSAKLYRNFKDAAKQKLKQ